MTMVNLDDPEVYRQLDPSHMLARIHELPLQCRQAWQRASELELPGDYAKVDKIVILGMGGSAIGGDFLHSLAALESGPLVFVHRDYDLPPFVDGDTLLIASSYSGNTEETLSAFGQALESPAKKLAITTGGELKTIAEERKIPLLTIEYVSPPRAALVYSFVSLLGICQQLGLLADKSRDIAEMLEVLEELSPKIDERSPLAQNPAKQLANRLLGHVGVVYGAGILSEVAHRWKTQLNENSKNWAFYEILPELNHNAVVGYEFPPEMADKMFVVFLRSPSLHRRILTRYQVTSGILQKAGVSYRVVEATGVSVLSQMMSLVLFGDYVSYYLALLNQTDPSPVSIIDYLKTELAQA
ncbi:MAG: bifunctional phosphoglucose/phosphomannose isomerase [Chloroflexi bacterium RBG_13_54_9]|nr:MAG: bifunctional phosphoglucose/phosphomannose isomerase [Chloroflexi bacterium RBG_13_54_9]